jgi:hypothetical protein
MSERLERLLDAHVQHELACWRSDRIARTLGDRIHSLFLWFGEVKLDDVVTPEQIADIIERYVIQLRVSGGITELTGEMSRLVFTSHATAEARLDQILTPDMYEEFADKVLALEGVRRELIALVARSSSAKSLSAHLVARAVLDLLAVANRVTPAPLSSLATRAGRAVLPRLEQLATLALERHRERIADEYESRLIELLDPERLRSIVDEVWDRVSTKRLSEVFSHVEEQDIEDFVVLVYEFWQRYRKTDFFRRISTEATAYFFQKYGQVTLLALIDDMGVTEAMVTQEVASLLRPILDHAIQSGALERALRRELEAFYRSDAARAALGE